MSPAEVLALIPRFCRNGHHLTPDNSREEQNASSKNGVRIRCKTCVAEQKARAYATAEAEAKRTAYLAQPEVRARRLAYHHWYEYGDPKGRSWDEIKQQIQGATS